MRVQVDADRCEGNAICTALAPQLFDLDDDEIAVVLVETIEPQSPQLEAAQRAVDACPRLAISIVA